MEKSGNGIGTGQGPSSSSSRSIGNSPSSSEELAHSGASTQVEDDREHTRYNDEKRSNDDEKDKEYEERGLVEIEEDGGKRQVMLVVEQKSGKEMFRDVGGGPYTQPRWSVSPLSWISELSIADQVGATHCRLSSQNTQLRLHHCHWTILESRQRPQPGSGQSCSSIGSLP